MLSSEELAAIRGRADGATDGGWSFILKEDFITSDSDGDVVFALDTYRNEDATFIAHARTDVPALVATIAEVRAELVKHFDDIDIDIDYEGKPNDLDSVVSLACQDLKNTRRHSESETERANVAEHKASQLRSRFALELAAHTTPRMVDMERLNARIAELEDVGKDNQYIVETLARALSVDLGAHCITELVHAAADMIKQLKDINGGLRAWQDVARPKLEARIAELEASQQPRDMADAPDANGSEVYAITHLRRVDSLFQKLDGEDVWADSFDGWLPLPTQTEDKS